ncbi:MAG: MFS transporter [Patescibacteria group bacterium]
MGNWYLLSLFEKILRIFIIFIMMNSNIKTQNKKNVIYLGLTSLFVDISSEMIFTVMPIFLKNVLGASYAIVGFIDGISEITANILKYVSGEISDFIQKRKLLTIIGYSFSAISKIFFALANSWPFVLVFRVFDRVGKGIRTSPRDALIKESVPAEETGKWFGFHRSMDTAGAFIGVFLSIVILYYLTNFQHFNLEKTIRTILFFSVIPAFIGIIFLFLVKEPKSTELTTKKNLFEFKSFSKNYYLLILIFSLFSLGNISYSFYLLKAQTLIQSIYFLPILYLIYNLFYMLSSYPAGKLSDKIGREKVLIFGFLLLFFVLLFMAYLNSLILLFPIFAFLGITAGIYDGTSKAFISDLIKKEVSGGAFGFYYMITGICTLIGNSLFGFIWDKIGNQVSFLISAIIILIATLTFFFLRNRLK